MTPAVSAHTVLANYVVLCQTHCASLCLLYEQQCRALPMYVHSPAHIGVPYPCLHTQQHLHVPVTIEGSLLPTPTSCRSTRSTLGQGSLAVALDPSSCCLAVASSRAWSCQALCAHSRSCSVLY
jgi:hypothetical protein